MNFMLFFIHDIDVCIVRLEQMHGSILLRKYVHFVTDVDCYII